MKVETTKMSSRGQIVIPHDVREAISAGEGTIFAITGGADTIILKKVKTPSREDLIKELSIIAIAGRKRLQMKGITESDIPKIVEKYRKR